MYAKNQKSNLKENWHRKGKINEVVNRGKIIHIRKKKKTLTTMYFVYQ